MLYLGVLSGLGGGGGKLRCKPALPAGHMHTQSNYMRLRGVRALALTWETIYMLLCMSSNLCLLLGYLYGCTNCGKHWTGGA